ncbi:SDR family oxidoreductase [Nitrospirillum sp. BR 11164]|uniref:SDR family NAD(P)-dependent oxidoreductase n=1 Tax=Nitrospirillum sp. BR 11164 TaxID=3104324 RepID=UPI002AFF8BAA|nr:SDR family oxidoreductase [Nitrospirillum sp. BR 11164]MEA1648693.1 SDR family oxidoreductase [Nitrospirillum sp. BR 11164]
MDLKIAGKTALVTGSTAGIGLEIARKLAVEGAAVIVTGRDGRKLDQAVESIRASGGVPVTGVQVAGVRADITTADGAAELLGQVPSADILVNNLGIYESKSFADISDADWQRYFDVNVMSGVRLTRHYFPQMLARNDGRVIFVSSETGLAVDPAMIHYAMTKTAQLSIARGLAGQTKGTRVTVNSVMPGPTRSEGIVDFLRGVSSKPDTTVAEAEAEFFATARSGSLLQRMIEPEEIANMVAFLASPLSAATNGAAIRLEGGLINTLA